MDQTLRLSTASRGSDRNRIAAWTALAVFVVAGATIAGAWYFQLVRGLAPCPLCLEERIAYYIIVPLSLLMLIAALAGAPRQLLAAGFAVIAIAALCNAVLGGYHAGIEWHFWPGPADCTGPLDNQLGGGSLLDQLQNVHVVRCDAAAWTFLGISLAGYNALISFALAVIAGYGLFARTPSH